MSGVEGAKRPVPGVSISLACLIASVALSRT
jgi:hypothetical protein